MKKILLAALLPWSWSPAHAQIQENKSAYIAMAPVSLDGICLVRAGDPAGSAGGIQISSINYLTQSGTYTDKVHPYRHCFAYWCGWDLMVDGVGLTGYAALDMPGIHDQSRIADDETCLAVGAGTFGVGYLVTKMAQRYEENHPDKLYPAYHHNYYNHYHYHFHHEHAHFNNSHHSGHHPRHLQSHHHH